MPVFETPGGSRLQLSLPQVDWPELQEAANSYTTLMKERRVTSVRLGQLHAERDRAIEADRAALGKAIKEGKPDPGDKNVEKIEKEIRACNRRLEALEHALDAAESDLIDVLDEHRDEWLGEVGESVATAQAQYAEAIEAVAQASQSYAAAITLRNWIRSFPEEETSFRVRERFLPRLRNANGSAFYLSDVLTALREDAQPHEPGQIVVPWGAAFEEAQNA